MIVYLNNQTKRDTYYYQIKANDSHLYLLFVIQNQNEQSDHNANIVDVLNWKQILHRKKEYGVSVMLPSCSYLLRK